MLCMVIWSQALSQVLPLLWLSHRQAKTSGKFSEDEMESLKREFQHHKDKIHEYNIVMDTVSRTEGESIKLFLFIFPFFSFLTASLTLFLSNIVSVALFH